MSGNIPSTMPLDDLLKSTGYNCPSELQGKTFEEATSGGDIKISTNTDKTIDVSAYTEPVKIEPAEGYDATKKVTLTLENIPQPGGGATAYAWQGLLDEYSYIVYTLSSTPSVGDKVLYSGGNNGVGRDGIYASTVATVEGTAITVSAEDFVGMTFSRDPTGDIQLI